MITCGGIGHTHDDITMESIALAFDVPLLDHPDNPVELDQTEPGRL